MSASTGPSRAAQVTRWAPPVATGLLLVLCFPPFTNSVAPFLALIPLSVALDRADPHAPGEGTRAGLLAGFVAWAGLMYWIPIALSPSTALAVPLYAVTVALLAASTGLFGWLAHRLRHGLAVPLWLAVPVAWTATEWLRAHLGPLSFPWLELGVSLSRTPRLAGSAELVGTRGLSFWLALVAGWLATALVSRRRDRRKAVVVAAVVAVLPAAWGVYRFETLVLEPLATVAVVQPNVSRADRTQQGAADMALTRLEELHSAVPTAIDLVVWPEAALTSDPRQNPELAARISALVDRGGAPVLFGTYLEEEGRGRFPLTYNGALGWVPGSGDVGNGYRKRRLVPGVEAVPFIDPARGGMGSRFAAFGRGRGPGVMELPGLPALGVLICYESIFSRDALAAARAGAKFLVNLTNDAWFGGRDGRIRTAALYQHPAHLSLRAIELRQGVVRAANTGVSLFIDPLGRVQSSSDVFVPTVLVETVYGVRGRTLYARLGDWVGSVSVLLVVLCLLRLWWRDRRAPTAPSVEPVG